MRTFLFYLCLFVVIVAGMVVAVNLKNQKVEAVENFQDGKPRFGRNLKVLTHVESKEQLTKIMENIADALGVKCSYCHNVQNYASDEKPAKQKARTMLRMVMTINRDFINWEGAEIVDCYTCHRGKPKPEAISAKK